MDQTNTTPPPARASGSLNDVFWPRPGYRVTPILMLINILVFGLMVISGVSIMSPTGQDLVNWGANFSPMTRTGEPWRLLTACFLHIGLIHLVVNMMSLRYLGMQIEPLIGSWRFLLAYLATGLTGSLASLWWHDVVVSAGASGAIFGLVGVLLALSTTNIFVGQVRGAMLKSTLSIVGLNLLIGLGIGADNAAHIGGLLGGVLTGFVFYFGIRAELGWPVNAFLASTWVAVGVPALLVIVSAILLL